MTWTAQENSQILTEYHRNLSITLTQVWMCARINNEPPARNTILRCGRNFKNSDPQHIVQEAEGCEVLTNNHSSTGFISRKTNTKHRGS